MRITGEVYSINELSEHSVAPEVIPLSPEQCNLIREICTCWGDTKEKDIKVGQCLAKLRLPKRAWKLNLLNLPMTYSWARRLIKIAGSERILSNIDRMPDARSTLHEVTLLSDKEFRARFLQAVRCGGSTRAAASAPAGGGLLACVGHIGSE